jgi:hypothetical protein
MGKWPHEPGSENRGPHGCNHAIWPPAIFMGPGDPSEVVTIPSGKAHSPGASALFGTQHIITGQWVRLVKPIRGRCRPFVRPILPSLPMGSFGKTGHWLRSRKAHSPGASTLFGTQHIITGQWVRLAQPIRGRSRPFMRPILPSLPMGSWLMSPNCWSASAVPSPGRVPERGCELALKGMPAQPSPPPGTGPEQRPTSWGHEPGSFGKKTSNHGWGE